MIDLSILIISYNTKDILLDCLRSVYASRTRFSFEVIVADNDSKDDSVQAVREAYPQVKVLDRKVNDGFACGNNAAAIHATGTYVWLLNSDTILFPDTIEQLMDLAIKHDSMIASCRLLNRDETIQPHGGALPNKTNIATWMLKLDALPFISKIIPPYQNPHPRGVGPSTPGVARVGWIGGTAMLVRRDLYEAMQGLDKHIFMYGEDVEFCLRAAKQRIPIHLFTKPALIHLGQQSGSKEKSIVGEFKGLSYIMRKHGNWFDRLYLRLMLKTGAAIRIATSILLNKQEMRRIYVNAFKVA